jgi:hypothetical protein
MAELAPPRAFRRGDSNRDGTVDIADAINTLNGLFLGTGSAFAVDCLDRLDANDDGSADIADAVFSLVWLFAGGIRRRRRVRMRWAKTHGRPLDLLE